MIKILYNPKLHERAKWLRNNATLAEVLLWQKIKNKQLLGYDFHRQKPMLNYIVDFFCPKLNLIIEIDGISHDFKMEYDVVRQKELETLNLYLLRFSDSDVKKDIGNIVQRIVDWIDQHTPTPLIRGD